MPALSTTPLVFDTSAWVRQAELGDRWRASAREGLLVACPVVVLEILTTTRDQNEFELVDESVAHLPQAPVTASVGAAALTAARELGGRRRLPPADYLIAAAAAERGYGVLHEDRHFETLATVLPFRSVRLSDLA